MKNNRRVIIKDEKLKKIRYNLRKVLILSTYDQIEIYRNFSYLYWDAHNLTDDEEKESLSLEARKRNLRDTLNDSICVCSLCSKDNRDMVYIKSHKIWYCTKCQDKGDIWYPWIGSEEVNPNRGFIKAHKERIKLEKLKKEKVSKD
jgi:ribosomal protein L37AE/L43A